jgi:hypothetical protein
MLRESPKCPGVMIEDMTTRTITRPVETEAMLAALQDVPPSALTACGEWTAHDIGAHLAGGCEEVTVMCAPTPRGGR